MKRLFLALALLLVSLAAVSCGRSHDRVTAPILPSDTIVSGVLVEKDPSPMAVDGGLVLWLQLASGNRQRAMLPSQFGRSDDPHVQSLYAIADRLVIGQRVTLIGTRYDDLLLVSDIRVAF